MQVVNGRLSGVAFQAAHAFGGALKDPRWIVCHDTASGLRKGGVCEYFASKECKVSAHFVVDRDGTITQMVPLDRRAYHAGVSKWEGVSGLNSCSIGIEIVNPGKMDAKGVAWFGAAVDKSEISKKGTPEHGMGYWLPYTPEQVASVTAICRALVEEYPSCNDIITHWMISPGRKIDTNPLFPLDDVKRAVFDPKPDEIVEPEPPKVRPAAVPTRAGEARRSKSVWLILSMMVSGIVDWFFNVVGWISHGLDAIIEILQSSQAEALGLMEPVTSLASMLKVNLVGVLFWIGIGILGIVLARHTKDKVEKAWLKLKLGEGK